MQFLKRISQVVFALFTTIWLGSFVVDGLRDEPTPPKEIAWMPDVMPRYVELEDGTTIRYVKTGAWAGPCADAHLLNATRTVPKSHSQFEKQLHRLRDGFTRIWIFKYRSNALRCEPLCQGHA